VAREAAKQCGRRDIPHVAEVSDFVSAVKGAGDCDLCLIAALSDKAVKLKDALAGFAGGSLAIAVGPEGDFTPEEIRTALAARFKLVSLGPRVLKSDTAGPAMLAILNYEFPD
jgi:16S rRNA (uracil1498-N3)-methyltransferase